jgi:hypothetical protein
MVLNGWLSITYKSFRELPNLSGFIEGSGSKAKAYFQDRQAK